jgi:hypothetical protein
VHDLPLLRIHEVRVELWGCDICAIWGDVGLYEGGFWRAEFHDAGWGLVPAASFGLAELAFPASNGLNSIPGRAIIEML